MDRLRKLHEAYRKRQRHGGHEVPPTSAYERRQADQTKVEHNVGQRTAYDQKLLRAKASYGKKKGG